MKKVFLLRTLIVSSVLILASALNVVAYNVVGLSNFEQTQAYAEDVFSDVSSSAWYSNNVSSVYEYELMNGVGSNRFNPQGTITIAETFTTASRIHCIYFTGESLYVDSDDVFSVWYEPYLIYSQDSNILATTYPDYTAVATRADFAKILAASIDPIDLQPINLVDDGAIPDVDMSSDYADAAYLLYRAGVLTGSDENGTFNPTSTISRAEAAAIITRIVDPSLRKTITLTGSY